MYWYGKGAMVLYVCVRILYVILFYIFFLLYLILLCFIVSCKKIQKKKKKKEKIERIQIGKVPHSHWRKVYVFLYYIYNEIYLIFLHSYTCKKHATQHEEMKRREIVNTSLIHLYIYIFFFFWVTYFKEKCQKEELVRP